jgi:PAS domain S-box-containing protein
MIISYLPIQFVDFVGSFLMIIFAFLCLQYVIELRQKDRNNLIWTYLLWVCSVLAIFAISRSAGHILKQILIFSNHEDLWNRIRPYSGAINTFMFIVVASITLFFERVWGIYQRILKDQHKLQAAHKELLYLNQNLENLVAERTQELEISEKKYRRIFEVSQDMILVTNGEGQFVDLNPAGTKLLGLADGKPIENQHLEAFFANTKNWQQIHQTISKEGFIASAEFDLQRSDGTKRRALISGNLDRSSEGSIHFLIKDIEQRRLMEQRMAQADKLASIGELSAGIAHELNNPLGIILGYTQLLLRETAADSGDHTDLQIIEKHAQNCRAIVEDLLNFSRNTPPSKALVDIHTIIDHVLHFMQQHSDLKKIDVRTAYDVKVPALLLDEKKIRQVFLNLLMNARHALGQTGSIQIRTAFEINQDRVTIAITDTGCGIEKKNLSRIFDPFFTTQPTGEGTGLGLSVSYGIIKNHDGDITVDSQPGEGTTFTLTLPTPKEIPNVA